MNYIDSILPFVKDQLSFDHSGHGVDHALRVYQNAKKLLTHTEANEKIVLSSALLHDTMDHKLFENPEKQKEKINALLKSLDFQEDEIEQVLYICENISFSKGKTLTKVNAMVVRDADRLDALGAIGIVRTIEFGASRNRPFYTEENFNRDKDKVTFGKSTETSLSHFYDKLLKLPSLMHTDAGKKEADKRIKIMEEFLNEFYEEME